MPRNSGGTYTPPAGQPVVIGTAIASGVFNNLVADLGSEMTDSLDRSGKGAMLAPLEASAGSDTNPSLTFSTATGTGLFADTANLGIAVGGGQVASIGQTSLGVEGLAVTQLSSNTSLLLVGNRSAADSGTDVVLNGQATRTAGNLLKVENNGTAKLTVDFAGQVLWPNGPTDTGTNAGPSSIATALTTNTNVTAGNGLAYWKDPFGMVHLKGKITNATGGGITNIATTTPLPSGFRPAAVRIFALAGDVSTVYNVAVNTTGTIVSDVTINNGLAVYLDGICFLAEA